MKKFVCAMLALLLCGLAVATVVMDGKMPELPTAEKTAESAAEAGVDYAAIYALHEPDEVVMTVDGRDVTWAEYFYFYHNEAVGQENQFLMYQYYGMAVGWNSQADEEGHTYADLLGANVETALCSFYLWEDVERESGAVLTEEEEQQMQAEHEGYIPYFAGEGATEEDMFAVLQSENYMDETMYWRVMNNYFLQDPAFRAMMGENGEKLSDEEVLAWAEEQDMLSLDRICISAPETAEENGEATEEGSEEQAAPAETAAEDPAALAQELAAQLQAVEDPEAREALFQELKAQYDSEGISYVAPKNMVDPTIYETAMGLEPGQVSDPVESGGKYYVLLRRPLQADDQVSTSSGVYDMRLLAASGAFSKMLQERQENQQVSYAEGFEPPRILDYYTSPVHTA